MYSPVPIERYYRLNPDGEPVPDEEFVGPHEFVGPVVPVILRSEVLAPNLRGLLAELEHLRKKAIKHGLPDFSWTIGEPYEKWLPPQREETPFGDFEVPAMRTLAYPIEVIGERPTVDGWRLLGTITPMAKTNLLSAVPGIGPEAEATLELYRNSDLRCDQCGLIRRRNKTLVLQNVQTGQVMQVGTDCASDYLGGTSVRRLLDMAEWDKRLLQLMRAAADDPESMSGSSGALWGLERWLATAWAVIKKEGWVSRAKAEAEGKEATSTATLQKILKAKGSGKEPYEPEDMAAAKETIDSALALLQEREGAGTIKPGYETNLLAILREGYVIPKTTGLATSLHAFMERVKADDSRRKRAQELAERGKASGYFGKVGDRGTWLATVDSVFHYEGMYGPGTGIVFWTDDGNRALWFASGHHEPELGSRWAVTATIKGHELDKRCQVPTTLLSRVKLEEPDKAAKKVGKVKAKAEKKPPKEGSVTALRKLVGELSHGEWSRASAWAWKHGLRAKYPYPPDKRKLAKLPKEELTGVLLLVDALRNSVPPAPNVVAEPAITKLQIRVVDNVLDDSDYGYWEVEVDQSGHYLSKITPIREGVYSQPFVIGFRGLDSGEASYLPQVYTWAAYDGTGTHPQESHQLRAGEGMPWIYGSHQDRDETEALLLDQVRRIYGWA